MFDHFCLPEDGGSAIAAGIIAGTAAGISDGSAHRIEQYGASVWIFFENELSLCSIDGANWVTGPHGCQEAYQSELSGIHGMLITVEVIVYVFDIVNGSIILGLDGLGAISKSRQFMPLNPGDHCFDILQDICVRIACLPIKIKWRHVKGHQNDHLNYHSMDWWG